MKKITIIFVLFVFTSCFADSFIDISFGLSNDYAEKDISKYYEPMNIGLKYTNHIYDVEDMPFQLGFSAAVNYITSEHKNDDDFQLDTYIMNAQFVPSFYKKLDSMDFYAFAGLGFNFASVNFDYPNDEDDDNSLGLAYSLGVKAVFNKICVGLYYEYFDIEYEAPTKENFDLSTDSIMISIGMKLN